MQSNDSRLGSRQSWQYSESFQRKQLTNQKRVSIFSGKKSNCSTILFIWRLGELWYHPHLSQAPPPRAHRNYNVYLEDAISGQRACSPLFCAFDGCDHSYYWSLLDKIYNGLGDWLASGQVRELGVRDQSECHGKIHQTCGAAPVSGKGSSGTKGTVSPERPLISFCFLRVDIV